jgi:hypothetical protein
MVGQKENFYWFGFIEFCILLLWLLVRDLASLFLGESPHTPLKTTTQLPMSIPNFQL